MNNLSLLDFKWKGRNLKSWAVFHRLRKLGEGRREMRSRILCTSTRNDHSIKRRKIWDTEIVSVRELLKNWNSYIGKKTDLISRKKKKSGWWVDICDHIRLAYTSISVSEVRVLQTFIPYSSGRVCSYFATRS